ncbi:MAG TPA: FtsX-like permease family protein, partial [Candidatus Binatus sp.]|nr:FtsX-like permease family protein [Candidatus Binatus sp.]
PSAQFTSVPGQPATMFVEAIDPRPYDQVVAGTAADPSLPADLLAAPLASGVGSATNPIPAILSASLPSGSRRLAPGDTFQMTVEGQAMTFRLVELRPSFPGITDRPTFAVVPFNWIVAAVGKPVSPSATWIRGPGDVGPALAAVVAGQVGSIRLSSRYEAYAALRGTPLEASIGTGFLAALAIAAAYMALTIIAAMVLSATRRTRDLAYLRTLGLSLRQAIGLTIVEHGTPVVIAILPGLALGIIVAALCAPGLGLDAFTGATGVVLYVDWAALGIVVAGLIGVVVMAIGAGTWLAGRARLVDALRLDDR